MISNLSHRSYDISPSVLSVNAIFGFRHNLYYLFVIAAGFAYVIIAYDVRVAISRQFKYFSLVWPQLTMLSFVLTWASYHIFGHRLLFFFLISQFMVLFDCWSAYTVYFVLSLFAENIYFLININFMRCLVSVV